jgi:hypothetical protein
MGDIAYGTLALVLNCHFEFGDHGGSSIAPLKPFFDTEPPGYIFASSVDFLHDVSSSRELTGMDADYGYPDTSSFRVSLA